MELLRRLFNFAVTFALLGVVAASLAAPPYLTWDDTAGGGTAQCLCADHARQVAGRVIHLQFVAGSAGAGLGLVAGVVFSVWKRRRAAAAAKAA